MRRLPPTYPLPARTGRLAARLALLALAAGCAAPAARTEPGDTAGDIASDIAGDTTAAAVPAAPPVTVAAGRSLGYLQWEDLGVRMVGEGATAGLRIDVTTLDEAAVALAGEDVRAYFADLKSRMVGAVPPEAAERMHPFLVAYSGFEREVRFDPTRLQLRSEGSTHYPRYVVPVSPDFDRRLVGLYQTVYAIYLFEPGIDLRATLEFQYADLTTGGAWRSVVERIERAKARRRE